MDENNLPHWRDRKRRPKGSSKAQAIWILGQWEFVPFGSNGTPLRQRCQTLEQAEDISTNFDNNLLKLQAKKEQAETDDSYFEANQEILMFTQEETLQVPPDLDFSTLTGYQAYLLGDGCDGPFALVKLPDEDATSATEGDMYQLVEELFPTHEDAMQFCSNLTTISENGPRTP